MRTKKTPPKPMARRLRSEAKVRVPVALNAEGTGLLSVSRTPPVDRPGAVRPRRDDDDDDGSEEDEGEQKDNRGGIRDGQEEEDAGGNDLNGSSQENEEDDFNVRKGVIACFFSYRIQFTDLNDSHKQGDRR